MKKKCPTCGLKKSPSQFHKNKSRQDGLSSYCKKCRREYYMVPSRQKRRNDIVREYRQVHSERLKAKDRNRHKTYMERNDSEIKIPKKKKCFKCKKTRLSKKFNKCRSRKDGLVSYCRECNKKYRIEHADDIQKQKKKYFQENKDKRNEYCKKRRKTDPMFRLVINLRDRVSKSLRSQSALKSGHTMKLIGCSALQLKKHLEKQFLSGMTWDNYGLGAGKWHADHIKPCASFDLTRPQEQKKCFHYTNLQPLWRSDNLRKNSYYKGKLVRKKS